MLTRLFPVSLPRIILWNSKYKMIFKRLMISRIQFRHNLLLLRICKINSLNNKKTTRTCNHNLWMLNLSFLRTNNRYKNNLPLSLLCKLKSRIQKLRLMILIPLMPSFANNSNPLIFCSNKHNPEYKNLAQSSTKTMNLSLRRMESLIRDNKKSNNCKRILGLCKIQSINSNFSSNNKQMISLNCNHSQRIFLIKETYLLYSLLLPLYLLLFFISECGKLRNQHSLLDPNLVSSSIADLVERKKKKYQSNHSAIVKYGIFFWNIIHFTRFLNFSRLRPAFT